ncbi:sigma-54-dependent Fis family transcriptional regulator [Fusibacter sp. 3D3]|uniref:sigma-54-dependent Fis family transcriptional regulator n=1 Tax=Fusibacter sp. 3D3 TaxID=1048380 RepID=UPI000856AC08|nr:sigma 54-interacting transcriptional regulator [Fusibacter sp. 3D3]GAU79615.1 two component-sigma54 specific transcriptional regulator [Fusibacter sp. 3D3]
MPSKKLLQGNNKYIKEWEKFTTTGEVDTSVMRREIVDSWHRSKKYGVDPLSSKIKIELTDEKLEQTQKVFKPILDIALPFMEMIYEAVGEVGMVVSFINADGFIMASLGDEGLSSELLLHTGKNVTEEQVGTNATGIALKKGVALQVLGAEHYRQAYHRKTTSAAPIKDEQGKVLGVLSMSGEYLTVHPHTLGMVLASSLAIEHELRLNQRNGELRRANEHLDAIMQTISEGIMTITFDGIITDINYFTKKLFRKTYEELVGEHIDDVVKKPVLDMIKKETASNEEKELQFFSDGRKRTVLISFKPIYSQDESIKEYLITIRETKKVYSQVNKLFGSKAIYTFDDILGDSSEINDSIRLAKLVAMTDATILLHGESGTGKEMFAQGIHNESQRKHNSFVFINCGAIPRDLVASELFGYVEGAFTSARKGGNPGKFELADGGTLFLDEIGDMPLDTQANLLRVLETKQVVRVGGNEVIPVDVRVIAATHKDLTEEVKKGNFRDDLFYRLNVMPIKTPSLRDRKEDIRILVDFFYAQFTKRSDQKSAIDESFYTVMKQYGWPGNVRELQNVMQMVTNIVGDHENLSSKHLPDSIKETIGMVTENAVKAAESYVRPLHLIEKEAIISALKASNNNLVQAAKMLEIGRSTLYRKLEKYMIL